MATVRKAACAVLAAGAAASAAAGAEAAEPLAIALSVGAASDYELRGISQTANRADVFGGADLTIETTGYLGTWVSNVDFGNGTRAEYDIYGGVRPLLGPVTLDLGFVRYGYTHQPRGPREDYTEWKVVPSMAVGPATFGLAYFHSDDFFGGTGPANYYEINAALPIPRSSFSISGALGRRQVKGPLDYTTWNLGVGYALNNHLGFDLRYWDTDEHRLGDVYKSKLVVGVKATFP